MNIAFVFNHLFIPNRGGVERVTMRLSKYFSNQGYNIYYIYWQVSYGERNKSTNSFYLPDNKNMFSEKNRNYLNYIINDNSINIIINQMGFYNTISKLFYSLDNRENFKLITVHHNLILPHRNILFIDKMSLESTVNRFKLNLKLTFYKIYDKINVAKVRKNIINQLKYNDKVILLSNSFKNEINEILNEKSITNIEVIANPLSFDYFINTNDLNNKKNQVLYVGRFDSIQKRPDRLLEVWKNIESEIEDWQLILIGDGNQKKYLENFIINNRLKNVKIIGYTNPEDYYQESKILCLTSNYEGFGMVLTEAQQYGVVPISFDSYSSVRDIIINDFNGKLIEPFSIQDYSKSLLCLIKNEQLRNMIALNAIRDSQKFSLEVIANKWIKLFNE